MTCIYHNQKSSLYGVGRIGGKCTSLHRQVIADKYKITNLPRWITVMHLCNNPGCINPDHLMLGTPKLNTSHMYDCGRNRNLKGSECLNSTLDEDTVRYIRKCVSEGLKTRKDLAQELGLKYFTLCDIVSGRTWKHVR